MIRKVINLVNLDKGSSRLVLIANGDLPFTQALKEGLTWRLSLRSLRELEEFADGIGYHLVKPWSMSDLRDILNELRANLTDKGKRGLIIYLGNLVLLSRDDTYEKLILELVAKAEESKKEILFAGELWSEAFLRCLQTLSLNESEEN